MTNNSLILSNESLEVLITPFQYNFPQKSDFQGYRNHCLRMLNIVLALSEDEADRMEKLEVALAFHDVTLFPGRTLDYLHSSTELALQHLSRVGRNEWAGEVKLMIENHHKIMPYTGPHSNLVEAFRKADWIDVSFGMFKFGLPATWLRDLHQALPLYTFYPQTLFPVIGAYILRHPFKPLPNFKW